MESILPSVWGSMLVWDPTRGLWWRSDLLPPGSPIVRLLPLGQGFWDPVTFIGYLTFWRRWIPLSTRSLLFIWHLSHSGSPCLWLHRLMTRHSHFGCLRPLCCLFQCSTLWYFRGICGKPWDPTCRSWGFRLCTPGMSTFWVSSPQPQFF